MRSLPLVLCLTLVAVSASGPSIAADRCSDVGCTACKPTWEDKKTKKPKYSMKCSAECIRGFDAWCDHGCCPEDTPPSAGIFTKKKLFKREEDKTQRVLKYELVKTSAGPCNLPPCEERHRWYDLLGHCRRMLSGW